MSLFRRIRVAHVVIAVTFAVGIVVLYSVFGATHSKRQSSQSYTGFVPLQAVPVAEENEIDRTFLRNVSLLLRKEKLLSVVDYTGDSGIYPDGYVCQNLPGVECSIPSNRSLRFDCAVSLDLNERLVYENLPQFKGFQIPYKVAKELSVDAGFLEWFHRIDKEGASCAVIVWQPLIRREVKDGVRRLLPRNIRILIGAHGWFMDMDDSLFLRSAAQSKRHKRFTLVLRRKPS